MMVIKMVMMMMMVVDQSIGFSQVVLSACSPYFQQLFSENSCQVISPHKKTHVNSCQVISPHKKTHVRSPNCSLLCLIQRPPSGPNAYLFLGMCHHTCTLPMLSNFKNMLMPLFLHLQHPIVILKDIKYTELQLVIDYCYKGKVKTEQGQRSSNLASCRT